MKTKTERQKMLEKYRALAEPLLQYVEKLKPWGVNRSELRNWIDKINLELESAPFIGLVVKTPPRNQKPFNEQFITVRDQNKQFQRWFARLNDMEVKNKTGAVGYRIKTITPVCKTEKVTFYNGLGWLSKEEVLERSTPTE